MQIAFQQLPPAMQDQLSQLTRPGEALPAHVRALPQGGFAGKITGIVFGVIFVGVAVVIGFAESHWAKRIFRDFDRFLEEPQLYLVTLGVFFGSMLILFNAAGVRRLRRSRLRPTFLVTPIAAALVRTDSEPISAYYFKDLKNFQATHHHNKGRYMFTALNFTFADGSLSVNVSPRPQVDELLAFLREGPAFIQSWVADKSVNQRIAELDWPGAAAAAPPVAAPPRPAWDRGRNKFLASCAATFVLVVSTWAGTLFNEELDDWRYAQIGESSSGYRSYIDYSPLCLRKKEAEKRHDDLLFKEARDAPGMRRYLKQLPQGRHHEEARTKLREIYAGAEKAYLERAQKADTQAADGMRALLRHLAEQLTPLVTICFAPSEGTDGAAAAAAARTETGSSKIHGWGSSFTAEQNRAREDRVIRVMQASFRAVLASELFDLQEGLTDDPGARFLVRYTALGSGATYTLSSQKALPMKDRDVYPGVQFAFDFTVQVPGSPHPPDPDPAKGFRLRTTAAPAVSFNVSSAAGGLPSDDEVYGKMVNSAFEKWEIALTAAYGLPRAKAEDD